MGVQVSRDRLIIDVGEIFSFALVFGPITTYWSWSILNSSSLTCDLKGSSPFHQSIYIHPLYDYTQSDILHHVKSMLEIINSNRYRNYQLMISTGHLTLIAYFFGGRVAGETPKAFELVASFPSSASWAQICGETAREVSLGSPWVLVKPYREMLV